MNDRHRAKCPEREVQGTKEFTWASADPDNPEEWLEFLRQRGELPATACEPS